MDRFEQAALPAERLTPEASEALRNVLSSLTVNSSRVDLERTLNLRIENSDSRAGKISLIASSLFPLLGTVDCAVDCASEPINFPPIYYIVAFLVMIKVPIAASLIYGLQSEILKKAKELASKMSDTEINILLKDDSLAIVLSDTPNEEELTSALNRYELGYMRRLESTFSS